MRVPLPDGPISRGGARTLRSVVAAGLLMLTWPGAIGGLAATPPDLAAATYVSSGDTGSVLVSLPRPVRFASPVATPVISVSGRGTVAAVALVAESPGGQPPGIVALALPAPQLSLRYLLVGEDPATGNATAMTGTLPAGRYRLSVATDGPVTVRLDLPGLPLATQRLETADSTRHVARHMRAPSAGGAATPAYAAGANGDLRGTGLLIWARYQTGQVEASSVSANCLYEGGAPEPYFSVPGCPGTSSGIFVIPGSPPSVDLVQYSFVRAPPGRYGLAAYNVAASLLDRHGVMAVWLDV